MKQLLLFAALVCVMQTRSQNILQNSNLSAAYNGWDASGCQPEVGGAYGYTGAAYWFENHYGGPSTTNLVAQLGGGKCLQQILCLVKGVTYQIKFKGSRRCESDNPDLPATLSLAVRVMGTTSFTMYSEVIYNYSNTTWNWYNETQTFTIPLGASDNQVYFSLTGYNITTEFGPIVDDITLEPVANMNVNGPVTAAPNAPTSWTVNNPPASGLVYSWSFPGATPSTSTLANPTNVIWPTNGVKTVSCVLNNGNCNMTTVTQSVTISAPLPVDLTSFTAAEKNGAVELSWTTSSEINNDYFIIQKSTDGINYSDIGKVRAAGVATGSNYRFTDPQAARGTVYYRLRQVDKNGASKLSNIVKLRSGLTDVSVSVYPTLVTDVLSYAVETPKAGKMHVMISDVSGRVLVSASEQFATGANKKDLDVRSYAKGMYLLTIADATGAFKKTIPFSKN